MTSEVVSDSVSESASAESVIIMTGRGTVNIAVETAWGCIVLAYSVIAWGILCSRREGSGVAGKM